MYISSHKTGHGHVSITTAITQQIKKLNSNIEVSDLDAFTFGGAVTMALSGMYNTVAVNAPLLWKLSYSMGNIFPWSVRFFTAISVKARLLENIREYKPRLIVITHPSFVSSILDILEKEGIKIPVVVMVADLDNVTKLWADKRTYCTLCPSENAYRTMRKLGLPEERLKMSGFPTRDAFNHFDTENETKCDEMFDIIPTFLLMNGSQGEGYVKKIAKNLLESLNCKVIILAGKNKALKESLEKTLISEYPGKITVCGFTDKVDYYMSISDVLILRASPNVLMEAVNLCKPVIVTGALTGQEEKNPQFVIDNGLGIVCKDLDKLPQVLDELFKDNRKKLIQIRQAQKKFRQPEAAKKIAQFFLDLLQGEVYRN
jgi:UDP-N-acetylglucosamine:LPS N-acetylglucosamine transferase